MRRPPRGATVRPALPRPGSGYGRPVRPGPPAGWRRRDVVTRTCVADPVARLLAELPDIDLTAIA